jgi:hypothetical protein
LEPIVVVTRESGHEEIQDLILRSAASLRRVSKDGSNHRLCNFRATNLLSVSP